MSTSSKKRMPPCAICGHDWAEHIGPQPEDADIDNGTRWCVALTERGECNCKNYLQPDTTHSWAVTVERNGEQVCTLASHEQSGRDLSAEDERIIALCARHLLGFLGLNWPAGGASDGQAAPSRSTGAILAALKALRIDANRLCDRNLGGTYEADCRQSIAIADAVIAEADDVDLDRRVCSWQPIKTAPKMRTILLFAVTDIKDDGTVGNWKMATGSWHTGYEDERSKARNLTPWNWDGRQLKTYEVQPTHWAPLPAAPVSRVEHADAR